MRVSALRISGYRSIRDLELGLEQLNVVVGPNGCGKSNLYRSLFLLHAAAGGGLSRAVLAEGGMPSLLWAGKRGRGPVQVRISVEFDGIEYELAIGLPACASPHQGSLFKLDPVVKEEDIAATAGARRVRLCERRVRSAWARDMEGRRASYPVALDDGESVLSQVSEPHRYPELSVLRQELLGWRFYHQFPTSEGSPIRDAHPGIKSPVLDHDGRNLAAAVQTIIEIGRAEDLAQAIEEAFGASIGIEAVRPGELLFLTLSMPGIHRPFSARELSDGTLRYLCLAAALLSPRPPALLAVNEPETSIHPDLIEPLARLVVRASRSSQLLVTTHSTALAAAIERETGIEPIRLDKVEGETRRVRA